MNYDPIPFDECAHRYTIVPAPVPERKSSPPAAPPIDPKFMWHTIIGRLLRTLDAFPEARAAYVATLGQLKEQYADVT